MKKIFYTSGLALALTLSTANASNPMEEEFRGNWTRSFRLLDGSEVTHTPQFTKMGFMSGGKGITIKGPSYNGIALRAPLELQTNSTVEEFIAALTASGLYAQAVEGNRKPKHGAKKKSNTPAAAALPPVAKAQPAAPRQEAHQLTPAEKARVPANFPAQVYMEIYPDIQRDAPSFNMDPLSFAAFQYGRWGHNEGKLAVAHVSYKTAPADFDSAQYLKNYPHLIKEAEGYKISDLDIYARLQYVNWGKGEGKVYK